MDQPGSHPPDDLAVGKLPRFSHLIEVFELVGGAITSATENRFEDL